MQIINIGLPNKRHAVLLPKYSLRDFKSHITANGRSDIRDSQGAFCKMTVYRDIGRYPGSTFAPGLPSVTVTILSASVIGCNNNHPFFIKVRFAVLDGFPDTGNLIVGLPDIFVEESPVSGNMPSVVGVPQINPAQVGRLFTDTFCGILRYLFIYIEDMQILLLFRKTDCIQVVTVFYIIYFKIVCFLLPFPDQHGTVIRPTGINGCFILFGLFFRDSKDSPVVIIGFQVRIAAHIMLIKPSRCQQIGISDRRDRSGLGISSYLPSGISPAIGSPRCYIKNRRSMQSLDLVGRNPVDDYIHCLLRLGKQTGATQHHQ